MAGLIPDAYAAFAQRIFASFAQPVAVTTLAPAYDLTFAEGMGGEHAMDAAGRGKDISRQQLQQLATQCGLQERWAGDVVDRMSQVASRFEAWAGQWPIRAATRRRIGSAVAGNLARMA